MKVHHLNCATMCPVGGRLITGQGGLTEPGRMVCHCLLVETPAQGLVLIDSGLGLADVANPAARLGREFMLITGARLDAEETAVRQVERLGYRPEDVRHIVVTHLDLDHAGGLSDFPQAQVHLHADELAAATRPATLLERKRYRPLHWAHGPHWVSHRAAPRGEPWFGFECVRDLPGLPPEILMVPMPGHTRGHAAVAVQAREGWMLHAGDAYFFRAEMEATRPWCPAGLALFQRVVEMDRRARLLNQVRLRKLRQQQGDAVRVFCAHDPVELEAACAAPDMSAGAVPASA
jgi:glyoxylase-like metal-dependent hydrolase (beta-lactamase superfamily II)